MKPRVLYVKTVRLTFTQQKSAYLYVSLVQQIKRLFPGEEMQRIVSNRFSVKLAKGRCHDLPACQRAETVLQVLMYKIRAVLCAPLDNIRTKVDKQHVLYVPPGTVSNLLQTQIYSGDNIQPQLVVLNVNHVPRAFLRVRMQLIMINAQWNSKFYTPPPSLEATAAVAIE